LVSYVQIVPLTAINHVCCPTFLFFCQISKDPPKITSIKPVRINNGWFVAVSGKLPPLPLSSSMPLAYASEFPYSPPFLAPSASPQSQSLSCFKLPIWRVPLSSFL